MRKIFISSLLLTFFGAINLCAQAVNLSVPDMTVDPGESFKVDIKASDFNAIEGMQLAIFWNPEIIQFQTISNINPGLPEFSPTDNFNLMHTTAGRLRVIWYWFDISGNGVTLDNDATLFSLNFKAVGEQGTNSPVEITKDTIGNPPLDIQASRNGVENVGVNIDNGVVTISGTNASYETYTQDFTLFQNSPNPFTDITYISFNLNIATDAQLSIYDASGKVIFQQNKKYAAGLHRIPVNRDMLAGAGSYFYALKTESATATRQFILQ